jgi:hypothetical protein
MGEIGDIESSPDVLGEVPLCSFSEGLSMWSIVIVTSLKADFVSQRVRCETAPIGYSIGEPQKNDLSDMGSWLLSFKGGI